MWGSWLITFLLSPAGHRNLDTEQAALLPGAPREAFRGHASLIIDRRAITDE